MKKIRPESYQCLRMYGLPKIQKLKIPFRSILFMVGSVQHELVKKLVETCKLVLKFYSEHCIRDSSQFTSYIRK